MRAGQEYVLRSLVLIGQHFGGDYTRGVIWLTISTASTGWLLDERLDRYQDEDTPVPNAERRPVSRLAVSQALGIPFETVRRHCNALIEDGWCVDVPGKGLIADATRLNQPAFVEVRAANAANVRRLLRRLGVEEPHLSKAMA
ncbi:MAG TPA: hypothetical protein VG939_22465 [Caulobacteraceae bacterium]|nr:hypothetical protein [Caulobacteraceae bacterium]